MDMNTIYLQAFYASVFAAVLITAVYFDLRWRRIPNWLTYPAMAFGLLWHTFYAGVSGLLMSVCGLLIGFGSFFLFFLFGQIGGGDVKLMAAVGAIFGVREIFPALFWTTCVGAILSVILIVYYKYKNSGGNLEKALFTFKKIARTVTVPYGVAIGGGTLLTFLL